MSPKRKFQLQSLLGKGNAYSFFYIHFSIINSLLEHAKEAVNPSKVSAAPGIPTEILQPESALRGSPFIPSTRGSLNRVHSEASPSVWSRQSTNVYFATVTAAATSSPASSSSYTKSRIIPTYKPEAGTRKRLRLSELLRRHEGQGKLVIHSTTVAEYIVFEDNVAVAVAVTFLKTGERALIRPSGGGEIILCAGALETPRLLIASGLRGDVHRSPLSRNFFSTALSSSDDVGGKSKKSNKHRGATAPIYLPGIGANLQDHVVVPVIAIGNWWKSVGKKKGVADLSGSRSIISRCLACVKDMVSLTWESSSDLPPNAVHGWIDLDENGCLCDEASDTSPSAQLLFVDGRMTPSIVAEMVFPRFAEAGWYSSYVRPQLVSLLNMLLYFSFVRWIFSFTFGFLVCLTRPVSRGRLYVNIADPSGPLRIDPCYLTEEQDTIVLRNALNTAHSLLEEARQSHGLWYLELLPGFAFSYGRPRDYFNLFTGLFANTYYHVCGTCTMGGGAAGNTETGSAEAAVDVDGGYEPSAGAGSTTTQNASSAARKSAIGSGVKSAASSTATSSTSALTAGPVSPTVVCNPDVAVVDTHLRVRGVIGLRIADASVFPSIPSGPIAATVMAVAEAAAELLSR